MVYNQQHSFEKFKDISKFKEMLLDSMNKKLSEFHKKFTRFKNVNPQTEANKYLKAKVLDNAGDIFNEMYYIYKEKCEEEKDGLNDKDIKKFDYTKLTLTDDYEYESEDEEKQTDKKPDKPPKKPIENSVKKLSELANEEETDMNRELFQNHFNFAKASAMLRELYRMKNKRVNKELVDLTKSGLIDLKDEIKKMSENEIEIEKPDIMVNIVGKILEFNRQNQKGQGLTILTPQQMITRLPISLSQLKAGNNSEKVKNEIRQLLYSLYRSKKLSKTIYNNSINAD